LAFHKDGRLFVIAVGALGITDYLQHPLFGKLPRGERLANIAHSPHGLIRLGRIDSGIEALSGPRGLKVTIERTDKRH